jgi:hypothetical protein
MADDAPTDDSAEDSIRRFEVVNGVEVIIHGNDARDRLARRVIENLEAISAQAVRLLESFMRDSGAFELSGVEVFASVTLEGGYFALQYTFEADRDPHEYNYTYFEVFFFCHEPPQLPFWPFKFTVGFH